MPLWILAALAKLRTLPWYAWIIAALLVSAWWQHRAATRWHDRADVAEGSLAAVKTAQATADKSAIANQAAKASGHAANEKETTDDLDKSRTDLERRAAALRVRIADLERAARGRAVPGAGESAGGVDDEVDARLSLGDELTLRSYCQAEIVKRNSLIDWEDRRYAVELDVP